MLNGSHRSYCLNTLGAEIGKIIMEDPGTSPDDQRSAELELLMKEREIVSQRLVNTVADG